MNKFIALLICACSIFSAQAENLQAQKVKELLQADKQMNSIGTTEEEIQELLVAGYKRSAKKWLEKARKSDQDVSMEIYFMRNYLKKNNEPLSSIGTNEEELKRLLVAGYKVDAKKWLEKARKSDQDVSMAIHFVREELKRANEPLSSIGTSEEELKRLLVASYKTQAKFWLEEARKSDRDVTIEMYRVREYLKLAEE